MTSEIVEILMLNRVECKVCRVLPHIRILFYCISCRFLQAYVYVIAIRKIVTKMQIRRIITAQAWYNFHGSGISEAPFVVRPILTKDKKTLWSKGERVPPE